MLRKLAFGIIVTVFAAGSAFTMVNAQTDAPTVCPPVFNLLEILEMSPEEMRFAHADGKSLEDLFNEKELDFEAYVAEWESSHLACIDQALENGDITAEQAEELREVVQDRAADGKPFRFLKNFGKHHRMEKMRFASFDNMAEVLGMTTEALRTALDDGLTLSEIAEEQGVDLQAAFEDWIATQISDIEQAVENGNLSEEHAEKLITQLEKMLAEGFDNENWNPFHKGLRGRVFFNTGKDLAAHILEALEMSFEDLREAIQNGMTLDEVANENGVDLDEIYQEWVQDQIDAVEEALEEGNLTQDQADRLLERLENQLDEEFPPDFLKKLRQRGERPFRPGYRHNGPGDGTNFPAFPGFLEGLPGSGEPNP